MSVTPRTFALGLGALALLAGILFLILPTSTDGPLGQTVSCGTGLTGVTPDAAYLDAGRNIARGDASGSHPTEDACESAITTRRVIGWPLASIGAVALAGALVIKTPQRS